MSEHREPISGIVYFWISPKEVVYLLWGLLLKQMWGPPVHMFLFPRKLLYTAQKRLHIIGSGNQSQTREWVSLNHGTVLLKGKSSCHKSFSSQLLMPLHSSLVTSILTGPHLDDQSSYDISKVLCISHHILPFWKQPTCLYICWPQSASKRSQQEYFSSINELKRWNDLSTATLCRQKMIHTYSSGFSPHRCHWLIPGPSLPEQTHTGITLPLVAI